MVVVINDYYSQLSPTPTYPTLTLPVIEEPGRAFHPIHPRAPEFRRFVRLDESNLFL